MEEFLNKYCFLIIDVQGNNFYYTCALVTSVSDTHITFTDITKNNEVHSFRKSDVIEIKLSNKVPNKEGQNDTK